MQLFREARGRAIGRGAAVLVVATSNGGSDRGTFTMYEAVAPTPGTSAVDGGPTTDRVPGSSCRSPHSWAPLDEVSNQRIIKIDGVNLNGPLEVDGDIRSSINVFTNSGTSAVNALYVCYTPLGRVYVSTTSPSFDSALTTASPIEVTVTRGKALTRRVLIPPTGIPRMMAQ
jgi:hypothetical protein